MINSELIFNNFDKFDIYPSHKTIFNNILNNIGIEKKLVIRGEQLSGKSFFSRTLVKALQEKLKLNNKRIIILTNYF